MKPAKNNRPLLVFYLLVAYVFFQFIWWGYLLYNLNKEIYQHKTEIALLRSEAPAETLEKEKDLKQKLNLRIAMIIGEGSVFLVLMILGVDKIKRTFRAEQELATRQRNFLLSITHELKSPIASTKLQLQTLQKRELDKKVQDEMIAFAIKDINRLNNLVENILLAAKMESDVMLLSRERVNLSEIIREGMDEMIHLFRYKQRVKLDIQPSVYFTIDRVFFPSIVINLFENAIKYSPADSLVTVSLKEKAGTITLSVSDEGYGIPTNELPHIFNRFYRIGNEETRKSKGTGLGLFIVDNLVRGHNGSIVVKNNVPKGSIFEIIFTEGL